MTGNIQAAELARQKGREALRWWDALDAAAMRYRAWAVLWFARFRRLNHAINYGNLGQRRCGLSEMILVRDMLNEAHDRLLIEAESMETAAQRARDCEMGARIYWEEYEERETGRSALERTSDAYGPDGLV